MTEHETMVNLIMAVDRLKSALNGVLIGLIGVLITQLGVILTLWVR